MHIAPQEGYVDMSTLEEILNDPAVEIHESTEQADADRFAAWQRAVERAENRAVSGFVRDSEGRLLLVRYDDGFDGWRLPGSPVGRVENFEERLRTELRDQFGLEPATVTPTQVQAHTAKHDGDEATYYYVLCETAFEEPPEAQLTAATVSSRVEFYWFETEPEEAVNPVVLSRVFQDKYAGLTPDDVFAALGHETRVDILATFLEYARAQQGEGTHGDPTIGFTALWERSSVEGSSHFNYHLDELVGVFLEKEEEAYRLSPLGKQVAAALYRWVEAPDADLRFHPTPVEGVCYECGAATLQAVPREDYRIRIRCRACDNQIAEHRLPPGGFVGRAPDEVLDVVSRRNRANMLLATIQTCPDCLGAMTAGITAEFPEDWEFDALPYYDCTRCQKTIWPTFGDCVLFHPEVRSFCLKHGIDPVMSRFWTHELTVSDHNTTIRSEDPWRVEVTVQGDAERLTATLDGELNVTRTEVSPIKE